MIQLSPAAVQRHENLALYPLLSLEDLELPYDLLSDAIQAGTGRITEKGHGQVPVLIATNMGEVDVLILDGEQLVGARQNRMASRSILLPAGAQIEIPVNCMEQGRWHSVGAAFDPAAYHAPSGVRSMNKRTESRYARAGQVVDAAVLSESQSDVWSSIHAYAHDLEAPSSTGALDEVMKRKAADLEAWLERFPRVHGQVGVLAFVAGRAIGMDVIGGRTLFQRVHRRLVAGYALDALRVRGTGGDPDPEAAARYLTAVETATRTEAPTPGRGVYRVLTGAVIGGELEDDSATVHLSAFPAEGGDRREPAGPISVRERPLPPPSVRRRRP